jgi:hypothetical protein
MGQEKGFDTDSRLRHNFGMTRPEGYRKAVRLMELADRFGLPVVSLVDTAGAFPGIDAEERGQAEAIARSTDACLALGVPNVAVIVGEGGSGGAVAIATTNRVLMLEHSIYTVASPEASASILWRDSGRRQDAATNMKITAQDLLKFGIIDGIIPEPSGGAHRDPKADSSAHDHPGADRHTRPDHGSRRRWYRDHAHALSHTRYFDMVFRQLWRELGGSISGVMREEKKSESARELLQWGSPTLAQIIRDINKHSNNVMARQLLMSLATSPAGAPVNAEVAAAQAKAWLDTIGVNSQNVEIENGAGLSRKERLSAEALSTVLNHAWNSPYMPEFIGSLPIVGVDGTMIRTLKNSAVKTRAHIKTGSLNDVASIAGYVKAKSGRWISVVCMINHAEANLARTNFNDLLEWIYEHY